jgi:hypothetical protein
MVVLPGVWAGVEGEETSIRRKSGQSRGVSGLT